MDFDPPESPPPSRQHMTEFFSIVCSGPADRLRKFLENYKATTGWCFNVNITSAIKKKIALHMAIEKNQVAVVDVLVEYGASIDEAVRNAVEKGDAAELKVLVQGRFSYNVADVNGWNALHIAAKKGHTAVIEYLLSLSDVKATAVTDNGRTALHLACRSAEAILVLERLLAENVIDVDMQDVNGWTALHVAVKHNNSAAIRALIESGANTNLTTTDTALTPLLMAFAKKAYESAATLLHYTPQNFNKPCTRTQSYIITERFKISLVDTNARDAKGRTALHLAVLTDDPDFVALLQPFVERLLNTNPMLEALHLGNVSSSMLLSDLLRCVQVADTPTDIRRRRIIQLLTTGYTEYAESKEQYTSYHYPFRSHDSVSDDDPETLFEHREHNHKKNSGKKSLREYSKNELRQLNRLKAKKVKLYKQYAELSEEQTAERERLSGQLEDIRERIAELRAS